MVRIFHLFSNKWSVFWSVLVIVPALILTIFGIWLFLITQKEKEKSEATRDLLLGQYPYWQKVVNEYVLNDATLSIDPNEAQQLIERQRHLKKDSLYLSVDSLMVQHVVKQDSSVWVYNYHNISIDKQVLSRGTEIYDAKYIANNKKEFSGRTHNQTGYLLILQTAIQLLRSAAPDTAWRKQSTKPQFFNANLSINDAIINQRVSLIGLDTTGKYLIQLSSRMPDATYDNHNNQISVAQSIYNLFRRFLSISWLLLLTTIVTLALYRRNVVLSTRAHRWLASLNKATCAIAIADRHGRLTYVNETFSQWNRNENVVGADLRQLPQHPQMDQLLKNAQHRPGKTEYYSAVLGTKSVHGSITYDIDNESFIMVDTDVSALRNMYDGELHSLKNLIKQVRELNARIILGEVPVQDTEKVLEVLKSNNHTLEKALLMYENHRGALAESNSSDLIRYDLELGLDNIVQWFNSLTVPLNIDIEIDVPGLEIIGTINGIELIFHNAIFNAIQAIKVVEDQQKRKFISIKARRQGQHVIVEVIDNGQPLPPEHEIDTLIECSGGYGLRIIRWEIEKIDGQLIGFRTYPDGTKGLELAFCC